MADNYDMMYPDNMVKEGNLDYTKPIAMVKNKDGSVSTVRTMSIGFDDGEVLIPTVHKDGYVMSDEEAIAQYKKTGENFGTFDSPEAATQYAEKLHEYQSKFVK